MNWRVSISGQIKNKTENDHFIEIDDIIYHYRYYPTKKKNAKNILLLHGFASSTYSWEKIDRRLNDQGFHVWSLDMKGFGWSSKPRNGDYDIVTITEEVNKWMEAMGLEDVVLITNSYGGGVGLILNFEYPKRVNSFVAIDNAGLRQKLPFIMNIVTRIPLAERLGKYVYGKWMVKLILREVFYDNKKITLEQVNEYHTRMSATNATYAQVELCKAINFDNYSVYYDRIREIQQKTLIIWGQNDKWIPIKLGYELNNILPDSRMVVIPKCGHIPQEEKPDVTFNLILDFIKGRDVCKTYEGKLKDDVFYIKD